MTKNEKKDVWKLVDYIKRMQPYSREEQLAYEAEGNEFWARWYAAQDCELWYIWMHYIPSDWKEIWEELESEKAPWDDEEGA